MPIKLDPSGAYRLEGRLRKLAGADFTPLMETWEQVIAADNRRGLLAGTDGFGRKLRALAPSTKRNRRSVAVKGKASPDNPPFIPALEKSRAIANFVTAHGRDGAKWVAI